MVNCINKNTKEFKELLEATKLPSLLLEMKISKWQDTNGLDSFPKVEDIINHTKNNHINSNAITDWQDIYEDIFNWDNKDTTSKVVIENILKNNYIKKDSFLYELANNIKTIPFSVSFEEKFENEMSNAYMYISEGKNIKLNISKLANSKNPLNDFITGFLHEVIHGYTLQEYYNNDKFKQEIDSEFNILKNKKELFGEYGITEPEELISELFSNPEFVEKINTIPKINLIEKILNKILTFLGVDLDFKTEKDLKTYKLVSELINLKNDEYFNNETNQLEYYLDQIGDYGVKKDIIQSNEVSQTLKAVDILQSDKAKQVFDKGKKASWDLNKILTELQVPKEQKQLILDLNITDREQIALELASNYSYAVEINTAKTQTKDNKEFASGEDIIIKDGKYYYYDPSEDSYTETTKDKYNEWKKEQNDESFTNTKYYSNLTVPGGTNYTENEISTPLITPSIKGHAQFSTDNGIGWFRSDDQRIGGMSFEEVDAVTSTVTKTTHTGIPTKTRRILEVQSDLFQKGRDKENLVFPDTNNKFIYNNDTYSYNNVLNKYTYYKNREEITLDEYSKAKTKKNSSTSDNQFLQLLNKNSNWVTFFVKSIIQDSAKKGYEKVLFPTGNTASKVEGHTTLEELKRQKEDRLKLLKSKISSNGITYTKEGNKFFRENPSFGKEEIAEDKFNEKLEKNQNEIKTIEQELKRVETEGFGALAPIYNFYENTVTNILKKQGYKPTVITDEYGNTWNEVEIESTRDNSTILFNKVDFSKVTDDKQTSMFDSTIQILEPKLEINENKTLFFGNNEITSLSADDVLKRLISSDTFENSDNVAFFLERAMNLLNKSGAKLELISPSHKYYNQFEEDVTMLYDSIENKIYVTETSFNNFSAQTLASAFIHEIVHSTTVQAYFNPKTFEEKEFKRFIDEAYEQYKSLATKRNSKGELSYGFTNQAEFIAEIFSNPDFRNEITSIEKNFIQKFIDSIRRLFEMVRNGFNNDLIKSAVLFKVVDDFSTRNKSQWKGTRIYDPRYDKYGTLANKVENSTLQDKIDNLVNSQINNISQIMRRATAQKNKYGAKNQIFINTIIQLDREVNDAVATDKLKAINHYVDFMVEQIDRIQNEIGRGNKTTKLEQLDTIERYKSYLGASDMLQPIMDTLNDTRVSDLTKNEQDFIEQIQEKLRNVAGNHLNILSKFRTHTTDNLRKELNSSYYSENAVYEFKQKVAKEYPKDSPVSKNEWINQQLIERKSELDEYVQKDIDNVLDGLSVDIDGFDTNLLTAVNTQSRLIQLVMKVITKMKSKIDSLIRDNDFKLDSLYQNLMKEKKKYDITNLYDISESGEVFVKSEYSIKFRDTFLNDYSKLLDEVTELKTKHRKDGFNDIEINQFADVNAIYRKIADWKKEHTTVIKGQIFPHPKYKNKLNFSKAEQAIYDEYLSIAKNSEKVFGHNNSLIKTAFKTEFYSLPYATVTKLERVMTGRTNIKDTVKQSLSEITDWKIDDIDNSEEMYRQDGTKIFNIPVMFRNNISKVKEEAKYKQAIKEQSYDLLTLMRLEHYNQTNFKIKSENDVLLNAFVDVAKDKKYLKTKPGSRRLVQNIFGITDKNVTFEGVESNTYKRIQSIVEQSLYNKFYEESFKVAGKDINKIVQSFNKHTAFLGMSLNYFNAPVNVLNAEYQTFLLKIAGDIDSNKMLEAHKVYSSDLHNILADAGRPNKQSLVNQLNLLTDVFGGLTHEQNDFIKNTILKSVADPGVLQIFQNGGEHMVQSVLNIALLKSIKVMNNKAQYINKEGEIVSEKEAATLFDMVDQNVETKQINFNDKFTYTDKSTVTKWNEGGFENVRLFVKKKIFDTMGEYDKNFQTEIQKHWWGQLIMMYKKFIIPLGLARYRGVSTAFKAKDKLQPEDKIWNEALQQYEEGFYTSTFRFIGLGIVQMIKQKQFDILSKNWNELSEYEKGNVKKGLTELAVLVMLQMIIVPLLVGMAGDDDDEYLMFLAMTARRIEQELSFYTDPNDAYKVTTNPIASMRLLGDLINVGKFTFSPGLWFSSTDDGTPRAYKALEKVIIPTSFRPDKNAKSVLQGMNRGLVGPYEEGVFYQLINSK